MFGVPLCYIRARAVSSAFRVDADVVWSADTLGTYDNSRARLEAALPIAADPARRSLTSCRGCPPSSNQMRIRRTTGSKY